MKKRKIEFLERTALNAGESRRRARDADSMWNDPVTGELKFGTFTESAHLRNLTDANTLRWLLGLAQRGFVPPGTDDLDDLQKFSAPYFDKSKPLPTPQEALKLVREFMAPFVRMLEAEDGQYAIGIGPIGIEFSRALMMGLPLHKAADWRDAFLLAATDLVYRCGTQIRRCEWEPCHRHFVGDKIGHQRFCSPQHAAKERERKFREQYPTPEKWKAYRRKKRLDRMAKARLKNRSKGKA